MPNTIDADGLITDSRDETQTAVEAVFTAAYGSDINLDSDTPDGQMVGGLVQMVQDLLALIRGLNTTFNPDECQGRILDSRCALSGVERKGGTFTITPVTLSIDRALSLTGLDGDVLETTGTGYTVSDDQGNNWILVESQVIADPGDYILNFRAQKLGQTLTVPNTITNPVTVVLGVTAINNPTTYTTLGDTEEQDSVLKVRRRKSVAIAAQALVDALEAQLQNLTGVVGATVEENVTDVEDDSGVPAHSIWAIVNGGTPADIAQAIYAKRSMGCGMKGSQTLTITRPNGKLFTVRWDDVEPENLFMQLSLQSINGVDTIDLAAIKAGLVTSLTPKVNEGVNITEVGTLIQAIDPNAMIAPTVGDGFGYNAIDPYLTILSPSAHNKQFVVSAINIVLSEVGPP